MRIKPLRTAVAATAVATAATAALALSGAPASAYGPSYCSASTCSLSNASSTGSIYFEMPRLTPVSMVCWVDSQWWNGTNRWFKVNSIYGTGYMIATQVAHQTSVGHC